MRPLELSLYRVPPALRWVSRLIWHIEHDFERARAEGRAIEDARRRIRFVLMLFVAGFVMLGFRAAKAVLDPAIDHVEAAKPIAGGRADLVDRNGELLAIDLPYYGLSFNPADNWDLDEVRRKLPAALPQLSPERLEGFLHGNRRQFVIGGLTPEEKQRVDDLGLPGVYFDDEVRRAYPLGVTAGHLIGVATHDGIGTAGAELALDPAIRAAAAGHGQAPLSIDLRIQAALQDELQKAATTFGVVGGSAIVTNVRTGEILAMASYPDFDPNTSGALSKDDPRRTNNVTSSVYEPGSVFKVFTLATGIDTGLVNINSPIDARAPLMIGGRIVHDDEKDNSVLPLWEVFTHSSNIGAARLGMRLGPDEMQRYFRNFGLFNAAPSELKESARPLTPPRFNADSSAYMAFGQGIAITPLALATGMGAVLNGGDYVPLTIRKRDPGAGPVQGRRVISEATSRTMLYLMRLNAVQGTGAKADAAAPGYRLGGKTGSAQKEQGGHMSHTLVTSFASVFPTDGDFTQDRYFVLVMLDSPHGTPETHGLNEGAWNAAPTVGRVIERIAPILGVARVQTAGAAQAPKPPPTDAQLSAGEGQ